MIHPCPKGQITLYPIWAQTWETFHPVTIITPVPTMTGAAAVSDSTHCTPHPATTVANAALWLMDAPSPFMPQHTQEA